MHRALPPSRVVHCPPHEPCRVPPSRELDPRTDPRTARTGTRTRPGTADRRAPGTNGAGDRATADRRSRSDAPVPALESAEPGPPSFLRRPATGREDGAAATGRNEDAEDLSPSDGPKPTDRFSGSGVAKPPTLANSSCPSRASHPPTNGPRLVLGRRQPMCPMHTL